MKTLGRSLPVPPKNRRHGGLGFDGVWGLFQGLGLCFIGGGYCVVKAETKT